LRGSTAWQTGAPERTLRYRAQRFDTHGRATLFGPVSHTTKKDRRILPPHIRQLIVDLKSEYPAVRIHELASICYARCGRRPSAQTIQRLLAAGPTPIRRERRYPPLAQIDDSAERRLAIIRLHAEGWTVTSIAEYLETTRRTVYLTLRHWVEEGVPGLDDKSSRPKHPARTVYTTTIETVRKLQENPELGEFRIHAALKRLGIHISPRTCGRILALNRSLYGMRGPNEEPREQKPMPFQPIGRHQYWTVDVRYLDMHQLGGGMIYVITILEYVSRAILASAVSHSQDLVAYLMVLFAAIRQHGCPEALVSDGGSIFKAKEALRIYAALGITKERIDRGQAWQSYIETRFSIQRRMADWHFAHAESWTELLAIHERWVADYNYQAHWAHRQRQDGCYSPAGVLGWVHGRYRDAEELHRVFYATCFGWRVDALGYVRFRHWRLYGERGLAKRQAAVWLYGETLTVEFGDQPVAQYGVRYEPDHKALREVVQQRIFETPYESPQLMLWELGEGEWLKVVRLPESRPRRRRKGGLRQLPLFA
jgi:putative transposase